MANIETIKFGEYQNIYAIFYIKNIETGEITKQKYNMKINLEAVETSESNIVNIIFYNTDTKELNESLSYYDKKTKTLKFNCEFKILLNEIPLKFDTSGEIEFLCNKNILASYNSYYGSEYSISAQNIFEPI